MKFACVLAIFVVLVAASYANEIIEIDNYAGWKERLNEVADFVEAKLGAKAPTDKFEKFREEINSLNDPDNGIVLEFNLLEYGRNFGRQVQCRFNQSSFNCLSIPPKPKAAEPEPAQPAEPESSE